MTKLATTTSLFCLAVFVNSFELQVNDECRSDYLNTDGVCVRPERCEHFAEHKNELTICSFDGRVPVVCCPGSKGTTSKPRRSGISMTVKNLHRESMN